MTVKVDRGTCIGCGLCAGICPEVFEMDEDNIAKVIAQPGAGNEESAQEAADSCPVGAIAVE
jgi:ferredoxin